MFLFLKSDHFFRAAPIEKIHQGLARRGIMQENFGLVRGLK
jgi:hypothetical protein